ncbi:MAG: cytochrome-c peroxidase [Gemmatimonadota bacterium]|nr:cytochrome-c peroxidase [Gemmatimonadota bacterium]
MEIRIRQTMAFLAALAVGCGGPADTTVTDDTEVPSPDFTGAAAELHVRAVAMFEPVPETPPALPGNELTPERVELGRMLYFEPRLSQSWLISCNTCHNVGLAGVDLMETSIGHGWQKGPRNAPTVLNAVFNVAQFWDGRAEDLAAQAKGPVQAAVEMASDPERTVATLRSIPQYRDRFAAAFPGEAEPVTFDNMALAIEAFEATLLTPGSPFDRWLEGDAAALDAAQEAGLATFVDRGCAGCHGGVNLGGQGYFPFGVVERPGPEILPSGDRGRFNVTRTHEDDYVFRAPALRNVALTAPYFHSGKVWRLEEAVRVMSSAQLGAVLSEEDVAGITDFLHTLTGEQPDVVYPILPPHTEETPLPDVSVQGAATH